jgi:hypothetical protein
MMPRALMEARLFSAIQTHYEFTYTQNISTGLKDSGHIHFC